MRSTCTSAVKLMEGNKLSHAGDIMTTPFLNCASASQSLSDTAVKDWRDKKLLKPRMNCSEWYWNRIKRAKKTSSRPCTASTEVLNLPLWSASVSPHLSRPHSILLSSSHLSDPSAFPLFLLPLGKVSCKSCCLCNIATCAKRLLLAFKLLSSLANRDNVNNCIFCFLQAMAGVFFGELGLWQTTSQPKFLPALFGITFCLTSTR